MLEIEEIIKPADQGRTTPFLCNASDGNAYYVKGYAASVAGLMKEWLGAYLAQAFKSALINKQYDAVEKLELDIRMKKALACWQSAWDNMPEEWIELNDDTQCFDPEKHLRRLSNEASGDIWLKLP